MRSPKCTMNSRDQENCDGDGKWACEYCTYENYPSAVKCTMCRGAKPFTSEDIYTLDEVTTTHEWLCDKCQQFNPPSSPNCIHCFEEHQTDNLCQSNDGDDVDVDDSVGAVATARDQSSLRPNTIGLDKWPCPVCTYENWSKNTKCVMCSAERKRPLIVRQDQPFRPIPPDPPPLMQPMLTTPTNISPATSLLITDNTINNRTNCSSTNRQWLQQTNNKNARNSANNKAPIILTDESDRRITRQQSLRRCHTADWTWLNACIGVIENDAKPVETYLASGGDPARTLTASEVSILNRRSAFDVGHTLVHLAIRFQREDLLAVLLSQLEQPNAEHTQQTSGGIKRVPSYVAPDLAADIRRHFASTLQRHYKTSETSLHSTKSHRLHNSQNETITAAIAPQLKPMIFPNNRQHKVNSVFGISCSEWPTFTLPAEIEELPNDIQEQLYNELLDRDAQCQLEGEAAIINWSLELTVRLGSRLYPLWNRSAGDCLLDSIMQATWGVFDRENTLRRALADSLNHTGHMLYTRWREYEGSQASFLQYSLEEAQWQEDWSSLISLASQPGSSLEQLHVFALAHILRRPIIVYGVKYVKSFRGETLGYARFEGVYLPLLWQPSACSRSPIALGYTRGHFSALVPMEPYNKIHQRPLKCCRHRQNAGHRTHRCVIEEVEDDEGDVDDEDDDDDCDDIEDDEDEIHAVNLEQLDSTFLPLMDRDRKLLPIHFLLEHEIGEEDTLLRQWMDVCETEGGILVAQQFLGKRPLLVAQMVEEWLNHYRRLVQMTSAPFIRPIPIQGYLSEGESEEER